MDLDNLKQALKTKLEATDQNRSPAQLEQLINGKSRSVIGKLKRSILFELLFTLLVIIMVIIVIIASNRYRFPGLSAFIIIGCLIFGGYVWRLQQRINFYEINAASVKEKLQQIIHILQRYTRLYFQLTMILLPVAFIMGYVFAATEKRQADATNSFSVFGTLFYILFAVAWSILMYFFTKWYIKKLYGNYLQQLKDQLKELQNG
jgi:Kef-type K+ transport system membrane component KefB